MNDIDKIKWALRQLAKRLDAVCDSCDGSGENQGYGGGDDCYSCNGTGVEAYHESRNEDEA